METWSGIKLHFARGYKVKYSIPNDVVNELEKDIIINGETFKPNVLLGSLIGIQPPNTILYEKGSL